jgi:hypothetical protein
VDTNRPKLAVEGVPRMEIEVKVTATMEVEVDISVTPIDGRSPGPPGAPRYRFVFSDDLLLERIDNEKPGSGLPQSPQNRLAGTHSGFATTLRRSRRERQVLPEDSMLFQYEGTFWFDAVIPDLPTTLPRGQVVARGVALFDGNFDPLMPLTFAIVGGTGAYVGASGQVVQSGPDESIRTLKIAL